MRYEHTLKSTPSREFKELVDAHLQMPIRYIFNFKTMIKQLTVEFYCPINEHPVARKMIENKNNSVFGPFKELFESMGSVPEFRLEDTSLTSLATLKLPVDYSLVEDPITLVFEAIKLTQERLIEKLQLSMCTYLFKSLETITEPSEEKLSNKSNNELDSESKEV